MKQFITIILIFSSSVFYAQEMIIDWDECFGGNKYWSIAYAIDVMPDDNVITSVKIGENNSAYTNYHGDTDSWVLILDNNGDIIKDRCFGGSNEDVFQDIEVSDDCIYFIGYTRSTDGDVQSEPVGGYVDLWVVKTDFDLNIIWERRYGSLGTQELRTAKLTDNGGLVLLMDFFVSGGGDVSEYYGNTDIWVCEIDADGEILWEKTLGNAYGTFAGSLMQTEDGKTIVLGEMDITGGMVECTGHNDNGTRDIWVVALDQTGEILWQNCFGGTKWELGFDIIEDNNGYTFIGLTESHNGDISHNHSNVGENDLWLVHIDYTGNLIWEKCFGGTDMDYGYQLYKEDDNGYLMFGVARSNNGDVNNTHCTDGVNNCQGNTWVIELDSNRNIIWNKTYGSANWDSYHSYNGVAKMGEKDFIIAGIIDDEDNHSGDISCSPYPINSGKSAWIYRLYDPNIGLNSITKKELLLYPNPTSNTLNIDLPIHKENIIIHITDIYGRITNQLTAIPNQTQIQWNCQNVASGVYFYSTEIEGIIYRGRILIQ